MKAYQDQSDVATTGERLFAYMVGRARFGDRLYFAADSTAARDLGVSRRTIIRARLRLERDGRIVRSTRRLGRAVVYEFAPGERRLPRPKPSYHRSRRVTQRSLSRRTSTTYKPRYARFGAQAAPKSFGRRREWRIIMGDLVPIDGNAEIERRVTPGQALFSAIVDELAVEGVTLTRSRISRVVKTGKEAMEDGIEPGLVLTGCVLALKRGQPHLADAIINDCVLASAGQRLSRSEYESALQTISRSNRPGVQRLREAAAKYDSQRQLGKGENSGA